MPLLNSCFEFNTILFSTSLRMAFSLVILNLQCKFKNIKVWIIYFEWLKCIINKSTAHISLEFARTAFSFDFFFLVHRLLLSLLYCQIFHIFYVSYILQMNVEGSFSRGKEHTFCNFCKLVLCWQRTSYNLVTVPSALEENKHREHLRGIAYNCDFIKFFLFPYFNFFQILMSFLSCILKFWN